MPTISGTVAGQTVTDQGTIVPLSAVIVADQNVSQTETVSVTLSAAANGTLSNLAGGAYNATTGVYIVSGTVDVVTAALDGLVFTPTTHQVAPGQTVTTTFTIADTDTAGATVTDGTTTVVALAEAKLTTLGSFALNSTNGSSPQASLILDSAGDLFGTTVSGGVMNFGTAFEFAKTGLSYAISATTLVSFNSTNGAYPHAGLVADAAGNLFGTTQFGGPNNDGAVFEIAKIGTGYASTPTTLVTFNGNNGQGPQADLIADAAGDLFGMTYGGGTNNYGTIFEIAKTGSGYASTATSLVRFDFTDGAYPQAGLIADAAGNLFGTTFGGGANGAGTVFEIAKTSTGYASTPTVLAAFNGANGQGPQAGLVADAAGDLFGTTSVGGANNDGTIFEIAKTGAGHFSTPTTLVSFNSTNGAAPHAGLIVDAGGNLFGTTSAGGVSGDGTVFEIAKTSTGYAGAPSILFSFSGTDGADPEGGLVADAAGNLFGTTSGLNNNSGGSVFELSGTGFQAVAINGTVAGQTAVDQAAIMPFSNVTITDANAGQTETLSVALSAAANGTLSNLGGGTYDASTGIYTDTGTAAAVTAALDGLVFTPATHQAAQSVTTTFTITDTNAAGGTATDNATTVAATLPPTVVQITTSPASGHPTAGNSVTLTLDMSVGVTIAGGTPTLTLNDGGTPTYDAHNSTATALAFDYTVGATDATTNLAVVAVNLPSGTTIQDASGNNANLSSATSGIGTGLQVGTVTNGTVVGAAGNDAFYALGTNLEFNGGGGHNTIVFDGTTNQEAIANNGNGSVTVTDSIFDRDGSHFLVNIEYLQFTDKTIFVENSDNANVARLYTAALGRIPDVAGLNGWDDIYAQDVSAATKGQGTFVSLAETPVAGLSSLADGFINSPEFQQKYGNLSDTAFVTLLYQNVLDRAPDQAGLQGWLSALEGGGYTREMVLVGFAESPENIANTTYSASHTSGWIFTV